MPKAVSQRLSRNVISAPTSASSRPANKNKSGGGGGGDGNAEASGSGGGKNHLFDTAKFGQHILTNPLVAQGIVDKATLKPTDIVLEVGPGTGNLTVRILEACRKVVAVEMDPRMAAEVQKRVLGKPEQRKLELIIGDFVKAELPYFDVCISNTPYQISSPLVFKLLSHRPIIRTAVLMFQREFALRLCATPATPLWCRLSANVQLFATVEHVMKVGKGNFRPPPLVESSVVRMSPRDPPPKVRFEEFDGLNRVIFSRRNKTVRACFQAKGVKELLEGNYKTWCAETGKIIEDELDFKAKIETILQESGYAEERAAKMDVDDLLKLLAAFNVEGIHFA
ncbi:putative rRNA (adenine-N6,N6-)-dimethyltransferase [Filobasidium floriforme]|uniref:putative rRNA (adenine-N6,N6-)-dimethyltransferase n=1 Tax=Filobasidium floriforme TaxID=5210 RepID=UPI001E8E7D11|nr:putative rRNA (adenine-N6,N6-)-dimethyltransferase [Filobasidium floriforme]KAH8086447.1 putative rRNA (adenine-N6,N6-)-dimethyltransferase [Filobasidium floriforme]